MRIGKKKYNVIFFPHGYLWNVDIRFSNINSHKSCCLSYRSITSRVNHPSVKKMLTSPNLNFTDPAIAKNMLLLLLIFFFFSSRISIKEQFIKSKLAPKTKKIDVYFYFFFLYSITACCYERRMINCNG